MMWGDEPWSKEKEHVAVQVMIAGARSAIEAGHDVVMDNCHVTPSWPRLYRKEFGPLDVKFRTWDLTNVSVEECKLRDAARGPFSVGEDVIDRLAANLAKFRKNGWRLSDPWMNMSEYVHPVPYNPDLTLTPAIIVDIDGTVALHGDERGHYDYSQVSGDQPNWPVMQVVKSSYRPRNETHLPLWA